LRLHRERADCENRIKELKADFGLDSFNMAQFWATEAALGMAMLAYKVMSLFRQAVMRSEVHHTLATKVDRGTLDSSRNRPRTASVRPPLRCRKICIEEANARPNVVHLQEGENHALTQHLRVTAIF